MTPGYGLSCFKSTHKTLAFFFLASSASAASSKPVAKITSTNCRSLISSAVFLSSALLKAIMPPKADVGSVLNARSYALKTEFASATPHGLACFTITHAGSSKALTHSQAASASTILLYESSLPWRTSALAIFLYFKLEKVNKSAV